MATHALERVGDGVWPSTPGCDLISQLAPHTWPPNPTSLLECRAHKHQVACTPPTRKTKELELGWETKVCEMCGSTPQQPSSLDAADGSKLRKWGRMNFHGPFCWWCSRAAQARYAWMNSVALQKFLSATPENAQEGQVIALSYLTLREEGRTQINTQMVEARVLLFKRLQTLLPDIFEKLHYQVTPLEDFFERHMSDLGNPIEKGFEVVQIGVSGMRRLAIRHPVPRAGRLARTGGLGDVRMGDYVMSDTPKDILIRPK